MEIEREFNVSNQANIDAFVHNSLQILSKKNGSHLIDVGAGKSPYRGVIESLGFKYSSHDFNQYIPKEAALGFHDKSWDYAKHDYVCDILEIPENQKYDVVLCTEVFEHVPDPVSAFGKISRIVKPGGSIVVSVPFMSLMHQAPHWHSSGLSPFWFENWSREFEIEIVKVIISGDYLDVLRQEIARVAYSWKITAPIGYVVANTKILNFLRYLMPKDLLESGGFTTMFVGTKR
jgi:SAM-dependent methyltransferase